MKHIIERAAIQVDQWDNVERGRGPDPENLRERAETLIDILRNVAIVHPYVVIEMTDGVVGVVTLYTHQLTALEAGQARWHERTGHGTMAGTCGLNADRMAALTPDYNTFWGGVVRGHVMHWWNDAIDIIVEELE